jgi:hypothetical protein
LPCYLPRAPGRLWNGPTPLIACRPKEERSRSPKRDAVNYRQEPRLRVAPNDVGSTTSERPRRPKGRLPPTG